MNRRRFLQLSGGAAAALSVGGGYSSPSQASITRGSHAREMTASEFASARKLVKTSFGRIAYVERGNGRAAMFLHGFPLNSFQWRGVLPRLSRFRRCIAPDFLALGYTEPGEGQNVAADAQAAMLLELLNELSIPSVDLIANDSGGAVAQLFVTRHPERVGTLLLTNCDTEPDSPPPAVLPVIELAKQGQFADQWLVPWLADKALARSEKGLGGLCYFDPTHPTDEAIDYYLAPLVGSAKRKTLTNAYVIALEPNPLAGIEAKLKECRVPTRIVWGAADKIFSPQSPRYLDRTVGNSLGVRLIPRAKLFFPEEMPELIAEEAMKLWDVRGGS